MKIILAVIEDEDAVPLMNALNEMGIGATKLASTGGFLLRGNTTLLIGVDDDKLQATIDQIGNLCKRRKKLLPHTSAEMPTSVTLPIEIESGGAIIFVLDVVDFQRL
ncbi:MAG TPA: hypothetical protein GXX29_12505 [Firmicutes bacterium]|nr:hypothetical protein [Bacillota bacterium]